MKRFILSGRVAEVINRVIDPTYKTSLYFAGRNVFEVFKEESVNLEIIPQLEKLPSQVISPAVVLVPACVFCRLCNSRTTVDEVVEHIRELKSKGVEVYLLHNSSHLPHYGEGYIKNEDLKYASRKILPT